jgi:hypothetical protein
MIYTGKQRETLALPTQQCMVVPMNNEYLWQTAKFQGFVCGAKSTWTQWFTTAHNKMDNMSMGTTSNNTET